ncbi:MAG TPA: 4Fe-4S dicluster domain-containing protein [Anaerolineales bacterium]|jgi:molybdopterin-containing oxidoreductase family iron-sulfur binding subunit|nr:4Fe-4S dicluster domain-containing protein [Anaerolineales bacterium]
MAIDLQLPVFTNNSEEELGGKWGMVIDQDLCTGCQACVAACSMENNVPFVGEADAAYGRAMHWIRIERFWQGTFPEVKMTPYQPMLCQQCHKAPCEPVCPVFASVHSASEDINLQVYNRCVGTRYCGNNCPYQVRAFNWYDYTDSRIRPELVTLQNQLNPDVTVRRRGVMEKCTFCIQRIHRVEDVAKSEGRDVRDGEVVPACAQACPASAIIFGRIDDPNSRVSQAGHVDRGYHQLDELGTLPRVTYLKGESNGING